MEHLSHPSPDSPFKHLPSTDRQKQSNSKSTFHKELSCSLGLSVFGWVDCSCLVPTAQARADVKNSWMRRREEEGKSYDATWRFPFCLEATLKKRAGGVVIIPRHSLFPPPTSLIPLFSPCLSLYLSLFPLFL